MGAVLFAVTPETSVEGLAQLETSNCPAKKPPSRQGALFRTCGTAPRFGRIEAPTRLSSALPARYSPQTVRIRRNLPSSPFIQTMHAGIPSFCELPRFCNRFRLPKDRPLVHDSKGMGTMGPRWRLLGQSGSGLPQGVSSRILPPFSRCPAEVVLVK